VFADSVIAGRLVRETAPNSAAAREITALVDELLRWMTWSTKPPKRIAIGARLPANPHAETWVRGNAEAPKRADIYTARLTLDITPALRARIKISAFMQGVTVAELLRGLLEREFPERGVENVP